MRRPFVLFLACSACMGSSLPAAPIQVSTTPMHPGAVLTLSVELQQPATELLEVQFYGSAAGAGKEPCVKEGSVCGGLSEPIDMGTARFFPEMKLTSVAAAMPEAARPGATFMLQAFVSSEAGAVASEVASVTVGEAPATPTPTRTKRPPTTTRSASKGPVAAEACKDKPTKAAIAACNAGLTGDIRFCEGIEVLNDVLYCFAKARKSTDACLQIEDEAFSARCLDELDAARKALRHSK